MNEEEYGKIARTYFYHYLEANDLIPKGEMAPWESMTDGVKKAWISSAYAVIHAHAKEFGGDE